MLFSPDRPQKKVTYEFHCTHKGEHRYGFSPLIFISPLTGNFPYSIMEIDARTFEYAIYGDIQNFGVVHWACPLRLGKSRGPHALDYTNRCIYRAWDARFNLSGAKFITNETPVFRSLLESIYIPYVS